MKYYVFKTSSIIAKICQFLLLFCAAILILGGLIAILLKNEVLSSIQEISPNLTEANFYPVLLLVFGAAFTILVCFSFVMKYFRMILQNLSKESYFHSDNARASLKIALLNILVLVIQFGANLIFTALNLDDTSQIFNASLAFYLLIILISFAAHVVFKQGKKSQEDLESII